jgi:small-conductance mechanosensitive channel
MGGVMKAIYSVGRVWLAVFTLLAIYGGWASMHHTPQLWENFLPEKGYYQMAKYTIDLLLWVGWYGLIAALINRASSILAEQYSSHPLAPRVYSLARILKVSIFLFLAHESILSLDIPSAWQFHFRQAVKVSFLSIIGWSVFRFIQESDPLLLQYAPNMADSVDSRRRYTYIMVLKRLLMLFWTLLIAAAILMTFERIRVAGTALLASAGVLSTVVLFSARGILENIFKGIQLALSQPIRVEDTITIEGETGTVSAITLHHVVVTLSDRSQLIVPTSKLLDSIFKNWTHSSNDLIGNVSFYINYTMPIEPIRKKFQELVRKSNCWDKGIADLSVGNCTLGGVELKLVMSAKSAKHLTKLRNEIREQLLEYMQQNHSQGLP